MILLILFSLKGILYAQYFSILYSGNNAWNPGVAVDYNWPISSNYKVLKDHQLRLIEKRIKIQTGGFMDPDSYQLWYSHAGAETTWQFASGKWTSLNLAPLGIGRSILPKTFLFSDDGKVSRVSVPGRWYYLPSMEWNFSPFSTKKHRNRLYFGMKLMLLVPYHTYAMPLINFQIGYKLANLK